MVRRAALLVAVCILVACSGQSSPTSVPAEPTASATTESPATTPTPVEPSATPVTTDPVGDPADVVFVNGTVVTQDPDTGTVDALAISGEVIAAVGDRQGMTPHIGPDTRVVDLGGRVVIPGFIDPHTHILTDTGGVTTGQPIALEAGITTVGEAFVDPERLDTLVASSDRGELRIRTNLYLIRTDNCGGDQGRWYEAHPPGAILSERVRVAGIKVFADGGTCGPFAVSEPFLDGVAVGEPFADQATIEGYLREADEGGYQVIVHAVGDLAIERVMDAYLAVLGPGGASRLNHRIDHNSFTPPHIVDRYDELGVTAVVFGWLSTCDIGEGWTDFWYDYGDDPSRALAANPNTTFAWHGDDPWIGPVRPLVEMFNMVTRAEPREGEICRPSPRLAAKTVTRQQAFDMMTTGSAHALNLSDRVGSLTVGKYADLVILTGNPLTVDADELLDIEVLMTMIGGEVEHCVDPVCAP